MPVKTYSADPAGSWFACAWCQRKVRSKPSELHRRRYCSRICRRDASFQAFLKASRTPKAIPYRFIDEIQASAPIPKGLCQCGCGMTTRLARDTNPERGDVRGEPVKYLKGHACRPKVTHRVEDRGFKTPCWTWLGRLNASGYARVSLTGRRVMLAHRLAYEQLRGPIPDGLVIDHLCRNPSCINPQHLEAVTQAENTRRGKQGWFVGWHGATLARIAALTTTLTAQDIAEIVGVEPSTIRLLLRNESWTRN